MRAVWYMEKELSLGNKMTKSLSKYQWQEAEWKEKEALVKEIGWWLWKASKVSLAIQKWFIVGKIFKLHTLSAVNVWRILYGVHPVYTKQMILSYNCLCIVVSMNYIARFFSKNIWVNCHGKYENAGRGTPSTREAWRQIKIHCPRSSDWNRKVPRINDLHLK